MRERPGDPLDDGRTPRIEADLGRLGIDVHVPFGRRGGVARRAVRAAHHHPAAEQLGQRRVALDRKGQVGERPEGDERDLPGPATCLLEDDVHPVSVRHGAARRWQLGVPDAARSVGLRRRLEWPNEGHLAPQGDLHVLASGQLEHGKRVLDDHARLDIAGAARDGHELGFGGGARVQEREAVVDPGIDVEQERCARCHGNLILTEGTVA